MDFALTEEQKLIESSITEIVNDYDDDYWLEHRVDETRPNEFIQDLVDGGWTGLIIPEEYGGQGYGIQELSIAIRAGASAGGWSGIGRLINSMIFGGIGIVQLGTEEQKQTYLKGIVEEGNSWALGITEPNVGLNTLEIETVAEREGDGYVVNGQKAYTSGIANSEYYTVLTRTTPVDEVDKKSHGLTMFVLDPDDPGIEWEEIPMDSYFYRPTYNVHIDDVEVGEDQVIGEVDRGIEVLFTVGNPQRITGTSFCLGTGECALDMAVEYAKERVVFDDPIGAYQSIQHPLAQSRAELDSAWTSTLKAAWKYDNDAEDVGRAANTSKLLGAEAAWEAIENAVTTFGGSSGTTEMGLQDMQSMVRHLRIAPIPEQMVRNYIAEHVLGLQKSY